MELLTASNFCIWKSIVLKCGCASKTPMVIETTVAFNKTGVPGALEVELETGPNLSCILAKNLAWWISLRKLPYIGVSKSSFTRPQAWQNCSLYVWVTIDLFWHLVKDSCCSAFKMCLSFVTIDFSQNYAVLSYVFKSIPMPESI